MSKQVAAVNVDRASQALLMDPASLYLGVVQVNTGQDHHYLADAAFNTAVEYREVKLGYPSRTVELLPIKLGATASLTTENMVAAKALLASISDSTILPAPPNVPLSMAVHAPVGTGLTLSLLNSLLLQQFSISLNNDDFYAIQFDFEASVPTVGGTPSWGELISVSSVGTSGAFLANTDSTRLMVGMPKVSINGASVGALKSFDLSLNTEYKRVEIGMPAVLSKLIAQSYSLTLSFDSEELGGLFAPNYSTASSIEVKFGTAMTMSFNGQAQGAQGGFTPADFSSSKITYLASVQGSNKLFTVV